MKSLFALIPAFFAILISFPAFAAGKSGAATLKGIGYRLEPIVGYETVFRDSPTPHTLTRTIYGARVAVGPSFLSLEVEYTKGSDTENFTTAPEKIYNDDEKAKLGLRSIYNFSSYFFVSGRTGAQATRGYTETTTDGEVVRKENPITYNPYAGASLGVHLGEFVSISAGTTIVFRDKADMSKNDIQNTISLSVGL
jgi:hypothetical protein